MQNTNSDALPNAIKVRGGAYLVEEVLTQGDGEFSYRAYDVPARCPIILYEFFPAGAQRDALQVLAPTGWSTQGFEMAKAKWLQSHAEALAIFEENGTAYLVLSADTVLAADSPRVFSPSRLLPEYSALASPTKSDATHANIDATPSSISQNAPKSLSRPRLTFADLWPDARRGAIQGGVFCGIAGLLLGALTASFGDGNFLLGAWRGVMLFPVGAVCGGLLGVLRALPSNAPALASASAVTPQQQLQSTLSGALKGVLLGLVLGVLFMLAAVFVGQEIALSVVPRGVLLFALAGAIGGAVVGFIRIDPRDRSRRN